MNSQSNTNTNTNTSLANKKKLYDESKRSLVYLYNSRIKKEGEESLTEAKFKERKEAINLGRTTRKKYSESNEGGRIKVLGKRILEIIDDEN